MLTIQNRCIGPCIRRSDPENKEKRKPFRKCEHFKKASHYVTFHGRMETGKRALGLAVHHLFWSFVCKQ